MATESQRITITHLNRCRCIRQCYYIGLLVSGYQPFRLRYATTKDSTRYPHTDPRRVMAFIPQQAGETEGSQLQTLKDCQSFIHYLHHWQLHDVHVLY